MKKSTLILLLTFAMASASQGQYYGGNPQWKWDTVWLFNAQNQFSYRYIQTCDINGNILQQLIQQRELNAWSNYSRITMNYEGGRIVSSVTAMWSNGGWYDALRITPAYDNLGRVISELLEQKKLNAWSNYRFRHYTYGPQNRKEEVMQERWSSGAWLYDTKSTYSYDASGFLAEILYQESETGEGWLNLMRLLYTCDASGNWLEALVESFETGTWTGGNKIIYGHDAQGNIVSETYASLTGNAWVNEFRRMYTYDANHNAVTGKNELLSGISWMPEESSSYLYYMQDIFLMIAEDHYRCEVSYRNFPLGIGEKPLQELTLYPNPASDSFRLTATGTQPLPIVIYNAGGTAVQSLKVAPGDVIDVTGLTNGLYLVRSAGGVGRLVISK